MIDQEKLREAREEGDRIYQECIANGNSKIQAGRYRAWHVLNKVLLGEE